MAKIYLLKKQFLNNSLNDAHTSAVNKPVKTNSSFIIARRIKSLLFRIKLNAFVTKFSKNVRCLCGESISSTHIIFECQSVTPFLPTFSEHSLEKVFDNFKLAFDIAEGLMNSPLGHLL